MEIYKYTNAPSIQAELERKRGARVLQDMRAAEDRYLSVQNIKPCVVGRSDEDSNRLLILGGTRLY